MADQVSGSMFGVVNLKLDCLDADWLGVGGWSVQHSTKGDLTCDFCTLIMRWKTQEGSGCLIWIHCEYILVKPSSVAAAGHPSSHVITCNHKNLTY